LLDHGILRGHVFIALTRLFLPVRDLLEPLRGLISLGGEEEVCEHCGDDVARSCEEHPTHSREEQQGADDHEQTDTKCGIPEHKLKRRLNSCELFTACS